MRSHGRSVLGFLISLATVVLAGCNGASPTEPTAFTPIGSISGSLTGEAVISGQLVQGSSALTSESFAATAAGLGNVQVSVVGTPITDTTDSAGRFRLTNAPDGTLQLQFVGGNLNAQLVLQGVIEALAITVQVQGSSVQLVASTASSLERFNELALAVTVTGPGAGDGTLNLERGDIAAVDGTTWWDPMGDYFDLVDVDTALANGVAIKVKGLGTRDPTTGMILVSQIRAKNHTPPDVEFDGPVASAGGTDLNGTILLVSNTKGAVLQVDVDGATVWDLGGDYFNLTDLLAAVDAGLLVHVEGDGAVDISGTFILAGTIKAEMVIAEFDGPVASASGATPNGTIMLASNSKGPVLQVDVDLPPTVWDLSGDYFNLTDLITAVNEGTSVNVEGDGQLSISGVFILAHTIKAEDITDGCTSTSTFTSQILDIQTLIGDVVLVAANNGLNNGQTNSLITKLDNAIKSLSKCNVNPAAGQLGAFINEVDAHGRTGKIAAVDAAALILSAQAIIASLP